MSMCNNTECDRPCGECLCDTCAIHATLVRCVVEGQNCCKNFFEGVKQCSQYVKMEEEDEC